MRPIPVLIYGKPGVWELCHAPRERHIRSGRTHRQRRGKRRIGEKRGQDPSQYYHFGTSHLQQCSKVRRAGYNSARPLMWDYLIGPIFALLPKAWRESLPFAGQVHWRRAAVVSGLGESWGAIAGLGYWYMYAMTLWVDGAVSHALDGQLGDHVTVQQIAGVALAVWWTHPLTLLLGYFMFEGAVRFVAAAVA